MRVNAVTSRVEQSPVVAPQHVAHIVRRVLAPVALAVVAVVHVIDAPSKFKEVPYLGWGYILLIASAVMAAVWIAEKDDRRAWIAGGVFSAGAILMFVLSRTTGLPGSTDDIGNWAEPLGIVALFAEACVVALAIRVLTARLRK